MPSDFFKYLLAVLFFFSLLACDQSSPNTIAPKEGQTLTIYTSFYPTTWAVKTMTQGLPIKVVCPLPEDEDAIYWQPSRDILAQYQSADLIILNGAKFEKWADLVSLPTNRTIRTADDFEAQWVKYDPKFAKVHKHGAGGEHSHAGIDGHTWLDPILFKQQLEISFQRIGKLPIESEALKANWTKMKASLDELDATLKSLGEIKCLASHPAYNYLAKRYNWQRFNFDFDPEVLLTDAQLEEIQKEAGQLKTQLMLWESEPSEAVNTQLKEIGIESVVFNPLENPSPNDLAGGDYLSLMKNNIASLQAAVQSSSKP